MKIQRRTPANQQNPRILPAPLHGLRQREDQLIAMAMDLAEQRMLAGTASDSLVSIYIKLGTTMAQLDRAKLEYETRLLEEKTAFLKRQQAGGDEYQEVIAAIRSYHGDDDEDMEPFDRTA